MTIHIALLKGINVGGHKSVAMADLRDLCTKLDFTEPRSLLQSGNLVFRTGRLAGPRLERLLETEASTRLDLKTEFFVRTAEEWSEVVARNPFREEARRELDSSIPSRSSGGADSGLACHSRRHPGNTGFVSCFGKAR